ncbi:MAG: hypothetical protein KDA17_07430, partial [Candidatus Saccharibacteria bacterium]|nr:hypothetical protein [Candidatus Saccharibacteria bacterium]
MSTTSKSFTATGFGPVFRARKGESFNYSVAGTFVGTVVLEKLDGASLNVIDTITTKTAAATGNVTSYEGGLYRWRCSAFTSGTIETALSDSIDEGDDNPVVIEKNVNEWRLGPGIFEITSEIVLGTDVKRIIGVPGQTTIKAAATITNIINATGDDCYLEGLIIDGGSLAKKGIRISGVDGLTVKDVVIQNTTENCVYGTSGDNVKLIRVKCPDGLGAIGKTFDDMDAEAWVWQNFYFDNGIFNNLLLEDCEGALLVKSNNAVVDNVKVWGGKYSNQEKMGIEVLNDTTNVTNFYIGGGLEAKGNGYNAQISLNAIDGGDCSDFYIDGVDNSTYGLEVISCSNMNFHDYRVKECSRNVLVSGTTTDLTFDNQILEAATGHYFFVQDADRVDILNTTITTSDGTNAYGITITNCDYTRVDGVNGFGNSAVKKLIYLNHSANHNDVSIDNIHAVNFSEHLIYFDASTAVTLTRYRVGDNITALSIGSGIGIDTDV